MKGFIFAGHGNLPEALVTSVEMMIGKTSNLHTICLYPEEGVADLLVKLDELKETIEKYEEILVFSDLLGGTPANTLLKEYQEDSRYSFISGMNFPMVLTAILTPTLGNQEVIEVGRDGIKNLLEKEEADDHMTIKKNVMKEKNEISKPMNLKHVRVDARGIHGQVATAWIPHLNITRIIVIDDIAVEDITQKIALKMARPNNTKLSILSTKTAIDRLNNQDSYFGETVLVIIQRLETLEILANGGFYFDEINLGNVPARAETTKYRRTIHLTNDEELIIKKLFSGGTHITAQMVPNDPIVDFKELMK
ncbi:PTS mannose/fructose/sorbose transporter subunit IIAB [Vagococcus sp.]|uniref:PTS mannose/fructose/sorbose transporter subunit IIAB n=1 Tax=Vagococcus sp. TaxID=1933889 RepID=UPI003F9DC79D